MKLVVNTIGSEVRMGKRSFNSQWAVKLAVAFFALTSLASCGLVDSNDPETAKQETDVRQYYVLLQQPGMKYRYFTSYVAPGVNVQDTLTMHMEGADDPTNDPYSYECNWQYAINKYGNGDWYYHFAPSQVIDKGLNNQDYWVELQDTLKAGASWSFQRKDGENFTARVTKFGVSAAVGGKQYDDVAVVTYTGDKGSSATKWFARNIGPIYAKMNFGTATIEEKFDSKGM